MPDASNNGDTKTRNKLAGWVVGISMAGVIAISAIVIIFAGSDRKDVSQLVFTSVLPLFGTWVGTVLAFYFARENFEAATQSARELTGRGDTVTPVTKVMIRDADWLTFDLGAGQTPDQVRLADLHAGMRMIDPPSRRLPIRSPAGAVLHVVHDSTLTAYAESVGETTQRMTKTLGDLLADPEYKELVEAIGFVAKDASVADARRVIGSINKCNDVFVTETGKRDERAIGWLTNTLLAGVQ